MYQTAKVDGAKTMFVIPVMIFWSYMVSYKTKNNKIIEQGYCLYVWDNLCYTIYHYIAANKVLMNKNYFWYINVITKPHRPLTIYFTFKNYFS